jgi:hypothetical protein
MDIKTFLDKNAKAVIAKLEIEFDSHSFINLMLRDYENEYVELLNIYKDRSGIFKAYHSQIGRYLSNNADTLSILKVDRVKSDNIKDYESENQKWRKMQ